MKRHYSGPSIAAYADAEADPAQRASIGAHLQTCAECAAALDDVLALRAQLRAEVPRYTAPAALRERVRAAVERGPVPEHVPAPLPRRFFAQRWGWLTGGALAGCAASLFAWTIGTTILASQASEEFAVAAVATHVRATLGDRLIDVASSDRHTVKPWLSARLDYSPPVEDLASEGIPLIGGRIDAVDGRPVATLVYRTGAHTIDVFVRPATAHGLAPAMRTVRGFNVSRASGGGMEWVGVSDVEADVLAEFVQRLARDAGTP